MKKISNMSARSLIGRPFFLVTITLLYLPTVIIAQTGFPDVCKSAMDGVTIEIPCTLKASYPTNIKIVGKVKKDHQIRLVKAGEKANSRAIYPSTTAILKGGEKMVSLHAPYAPGEYQLLYVTPGQRETIFAIPFKVEAPKAKIIAPDVAIPGDQFVVRIEGEVSPNTKINIVPVGSPTKLVGDHAYLRNAKEVFSSSGTDTRMDPKVDGGDRITGSDPLPRSAMYQPGQPVYGASRTLMVKVPLRLAKPGQYEIQYVTMTSHVVYARKPLTIK